MPPTVPSPAVDVPFDFRDGRIWITIRVHGRDVRALFDTGSDGTALDLGVARELGLALKEAASGTTVAGEIQLMKFGPAEIELGDRRLPAEEVAVLPLAAQLPGVEAILGFDVLRHVPMTLDYSEKRIRLETLPRGEPIPFILEGDLRPSAWVEALGGRFEAHLDTGSSQGVSLPLEWVRARAPRLLAEETKREILGNEVSSRKFVLDRLRIGSVDTHDVPAEAVAAEGGSFAQTSRPWANLGNPVLSRFRVGIDGERRITVLEPVP